MHERGLKTEPGCPRENINSPRRNSDLEDRIILLKVGFSKVMEGAAKAFQGSQDGLGIVSRRHDPYVNVHGRAGVSVRSHGIRADEKKLNPFVG